MKSFFLLILIFVFFLNHYICCQNYYVSLQGNDNNDGTTEQTPWRTIAKACSTVSAGSTVYIKAGTYDESNNGIGINVSVQGNSGNPITIRNFNNDNVYITRTDNATIKKLFLIQNKSYLKFLNLKIMGFTLNQWGAGFSIEGSSNNIDILNCEIFNLNGPGAAIMIEEPFGSHNNILIADNIIHDCNYATFGAALLFFKGHGQNLTIIRNRIYNISCSGNCKAIMFEGRHGTISYSNSIIDSNIVYNCTVNNGEAISLGGNIENVDVSRNKVFNINNIGINTQGGYGVCPNPTLDFARNIKIYDNVVFNCRKFNGEGAGIYIDASSNCIAERNIVYESNQGINIGCEHTGWVANNNTIRDNSVYNCDRAGILIGEYNSSLGIVQNCKVLNNTLFKNLDSSISVYEADFGCSRSINCIFKNNIVYKSVRSYDSIRRLITVQSGSSGNVFDYNIYWFPLGQGFVTIDYMGSIYNTYQSYVNSTGQEQNSLFINPSLMDTNISTLNLHLKNSSICINAGDPTFMLGIGETDIDKELRIYNNRVDCGSDENQPPNLVQINNVKLPKNFVLSQNSPNPFNPVTFINFDIPIKDHVKITVYDILGKEISVLVDQEVNAGSYKVSWDGSAYPSGVYFYELKAGEFSQTKKLVLAK